MDELSRITAVEDARAAAHTRQAARHRGVCWSACDPGPFQRRAPDSLLRGARALREAYETWQASPAGRLNAVLVRAQTLARAAHAAAETAQAALARDPTCDCAAQLTELRNHASALAQAAQVATQSDAAAGR